MMCAKLWRHLLMKLTGKSHSSIAIRKRSVWAIVWSKLPATAHYWKSLDCIFSMALLHPARIWCDIIVSVKWIIQQDPVGAVLVTELPTGYDHISIIKLSVRWCVWKVGEGFPYRVSVTQYIKMGSCVPQCDVPHQWIAQRQRPRVCILWRRGVSYPVSAAWHSCVAAHWSKYQCYKQAPSFYDLRCLKVTLNPNKQTNQTNVMIHILKLSPIPGQVAEHTRTMSAC